VGWIVRNFDYEAEERWPWDDKSTTSTQPVVSITGLDAVPLELAWFDDRQGVIIGARTQSSTGEFTSVTAPFTEPVTNPTAFGKSIAFVIQPVGYTPVKHFAPLPNEYIGQILVDTTTGTTQIDLPGNWHAELTRLTRGVTYRFVAETKPIIPEAQRSQYRCRWYFYGIANPSREGWAVNVLYPNAGTFRALLTIEDLQGNRITGDLIYVEVPQ